MAVIHNKKVLIVDDHPMIRKGLKSFLEEIIAPAQFREAEKCETAQLVLNDFHPDIIFMDIEFRENKRNLMSGPEYVAILRNQGFKNIIIMYSLYQDEEYMYRSFKAGANAYIYKSSETSEIEKALFALLGGMNLYATGKSMVEIQQMIKKNDEYYKNHPDPATLELSARELIILKGFYTGQSMDAIANSLTLSVRTLEKYRKRLFSKFQCHNVRELIVRINTYDLIKRRLHDDLQVIHQ